MTSTIYLAYAVAHFGLFVWAARLFLRCRHPSTVPLMLLTAGLVYDNAALGLGRFVGLGDTLENINAVRYTLHGFLTPLLMLSGLGLAQRARVGWAKNGVVVSLIVGATVAMVLLGLYYEVVTLRLVPDLVGDLVAYDNAGGIEPPVPPLVTILVLIAAGAAVWRSARWPWFCVAATAELAAAVGGGVLPVVAGNLGELVLLAGMVATDWRLSDPARRNDC